MEQKIFKNEDVADLSNSARFRKWHLVQILSQFDVNLGPFDLFLASYFRHNPSLGSKDRTEIGKKAYQAIRWQGLLEELVKQKSENTITGRKWSKEGLPGRAWSADAWWTDAVSLLDDFDPKQYLTNENLDIAQRVSFPKELYSLLEKAYGREKAIEIACNSNEEAPTTLRVNTLRTTREQLIALLKEKGIEATATLESPCGLILQKRSQLFQLPEFSEGYFEMQDEGSQLIAELLQAKPGDSILDFCSGSGGKTLAFAHRLQGKGQIYLHDIRKEALFSARQRLKRAGIQNAQLFFNDDDQKKRILKGRIDWVFVDAPCTGTGALRRNPDMKWRFTEKYLNDHVQLQREVFRQAVEYVKPTGSIVYATCSILPQENQEQVELFCATYGLQIVGKPFQSLPAPGKMDGFYAAVLKRI